MTHRARRGVHSTPGKPSSSDTAQPSWLPRGRECPWCGSEETVFVQRGLTTDRPSKDQYILCSGCDRVTYDIVARNDREIRLGRYATGSEFRDAEHHTRYRIYRMLKVGFNEYLLYLRPLLPGADASE